MELVYRREVQHTPHIARSICMNCTPRFPLASDMLIKSRFWSQYSEANVILIVGRQPEIVGPRDNDTRINGKDATFGCGSVFHFLATHVQPGNRQCCEIFRGSEWGSTTWQIELITI